MQQRHQSLPMLGYSCFEGHIRKLPTLRPTSHGNLAFGDLASDYTNENTLNMPSLKIMIEIQGQPARRVYVQHVWEIAGIRGPIKLYMTDEEGQVTIESSTNQADIRIFAQNTVARMVDFAASFPVFTDTKVDNNGTVHIDTSDEHVTHFRLLQVAMDSYDIVHRHFYSHASKGAFPFGEAGSPEKRRDSKQGIYIVYPDNLPQPTPFVGPKSLANGYPLLHLENKRQAESSSKRRDAYVLLFGNSKTRADIMPHELAHALHFSQLTEQKRGTIEFESVKFLVGSFVRDGEPFHTLSKDTTPMVASIEAFGTFSDRAFAFVAHRRAVSFDRTVQTEFIRAETQDYLSPKDYWLGENEPQIARTGHDGHVIFRDALFTSDREEGAIYGALSLGFAYVICT